jgi:hypothetical protein
MPSLRCPKGHETEFRSFRGSKGAGTPCPVIVASSTGGEQCGEIRRSPVAFRCNRRVRYRTFDGSPVYSGRCTTEPKDHAGPHRVGAYWAVLSDA